MNIERISNQLMSNTASRVASTEKTRPAQPVEDVLKKPEQHLKEQLNQEMDKEMVGDVVKGINDFLQPVNTSIKFVLHDKLNDYYVTIIDEKTKEVIKEIPSKKLLDLYANMMEFVGLLVDRKI